jgi:CARDB protein
MTAFRTMQRAPAFTILALAAGLATACSDRSPEPLTGPSLATGSSHGVPGIEAALAAQQRHTAELLRIPGVLGTAVAVVPGGRAGVRILVADTSVHGLPAALDGVAVVTQVTGLIMARSDPTTRQRPAPLGFSVGHPAITAGSIGARVVDGAGNVYVLSNNHVLANSNNAAIGDATLQPGPYDGGTAADQIATLAAFQPIDFSLSGANTIDAAIARSTTADLGNATPADDGYGLPSAVIFGDADGDGRFDDRNALLGLTVKKFGRTTKLTHGQITAINATVEVCYEVFFGFCIESAIFVDQLIIEPGTFSGGGDSGSLIVTDDGESHPVALLFAGSSTETIGNRIDLVLTRFGVTVDGAPGGPVTDAAVTGVTAPASVTQGATVSVAVTVRNSGNQPIAGAFDVNLQDATDNALIGTQTVNGLAAGASDTLSFAWNTTTASLGAHTLSASHTLSDDNAANNQATTTVTVNAPVTGPTAHVGDLDATAAFTGSRWAATIAITVHDENHNPLPGALVEGHWSVVGLGTPTCTSGADGTCTVSSPLLKRTVTSITFTVVTITSAGRTYVRTDNHDPDGDSNGLSIKVLRP